MKGKKEKERERKREREKERKRERERERERERGGGRRGAKTEKMVESSTGKLEKRIYDGSTVQIDGNSRPPESEKRERKKVREQIKGSR